MNENTLLRLFICYQIIDSTLLIAALVLVSLIRLTTQYKHFKMQESVTLSHFLDFLLDYRFHSWNEKQNYYLLIVIFS